MWITEKSVVIAKKAKIFLGQIFRCQREWLGVDWAQFKHEKSRVSSLFLSRIICNVCAPLFAEIWDRSSICQCKLESVWNFPHRPQTRKIGNWKSTKKKLSFRHFHPFNSIDFRLWCSFFALCGEKKAHRDEVRSFSLFWWVRFTVLIRVSRVEKKTKGFLYFISALFFGWRSARSRFSAPTTRHNKASPARLRHKTLIWSNYHCRLFE